jgi:flagellar motility protein MotE (MotC chaperone)
MRTIWTLFVIGIFCVGVATVAIKNISAQTNDPRAPVIKDSAQSGIRVPVPDTEEMLTAIEKKERDLEEREKRLKQLEERLIVEEERIKIRVAELEQLQNDIEKSRSKYKIEDQKVLARMVKTFETMVPKKAATVMASMEEPLAVELLMAMKEKKVAQVLEAMEPARAVALNALIAARRPAGRDDAKKEQGAVEAQK